MSDQVFANPTTPYWLSVNGVNSISFNKLANPPLAFLDKGILYELDDGKLYYNGTGIAPAVVGNVTNAAVPPVTVGSITVYSTVDGQTIDATSVQIQGDIITGADAVVLTSQNSAPDPDALWVNTADNHLYHGAVDLEDIPFGDVIGPASSVENAVATYSDATGKLIKNTTLLFTPTALQLPASCDIAFWDGFTSRALITASPTATNNLMLGFYSNKGAGIQNVGLGNYCFGSGVFEGESNTAIGHAALNAATTASLNTCVGVIAGTLITSGQNNTIVGAEAGSELTTGVDNTFIGAGSGGSFTTGTGNTCVGALSLNYNIAGNDNIVIGHYAGTFCTAGDSNVYIGDSGTGIPLGNESNTMRLGYEATAQTFINGIAGATVPALTKKMVTIDTATGQLGAEDPMMHATGEVAFENFAAPYVRTCAVISAFYEIANSQTLLSNGDSMWDASIPGRMKYLGAGPTTFHGAYSFSCILAAGSNDNVEAHVAVNGVKVANSAIRRKMSSTTEYNMITWHKIVVLNTNDYVSCFIANLSGTDTINFGNCNMVFMKAT